jgi:hypothetical protein
MYVLSEYVCMLCSFLTAVISMYEYLNRWQLCVMKDKITNYLLIHEFQCQILYNSELL